MLTHLTARIKSVLREMPCFLSEHVFASCCAFKPTSSFVAHVLAIACVLLSRCSELRKKLGRDPWADAQLKPVLGELAKCCYW